MKLLEGKKGLIFGISNNRSIAYSIAKACHDHGAQMAFAYSLPVESRVQKIASELNAKAIYCCDVTKDEEIEAVFKNYQRDFGDTLDFLIHSVAFAQREDLTGRFSDLTRQGWDIAMSVSAYSLIPIARLARPLMMKKGGSIVTMTYLGGERSVPNYNVMGVAKAALDANVRYLASEFGPDAIRVNAISAGPIKTLAAKGISGFDLLYKITEMRSPMKRNVSLEEVGNSGLYLVSDLSTGVTGEIHHVDCGYHSVATVRQDAKLAGVDPDAPQEQ